MGWDEAQVGSRRLGRSLDQLGRSGTLPLGPPTLLTHDPYSLVQSDIWAVSYSTTLYFCCHIFFQMLCVSIIVNINCSML